MAIGVHSQIYFFRSLEQLSPKIHLVLLRSLIPLDTLGEKVNINEHQYSSMEHGNKKSCFKLTGNLHPGICGFASQSG